MGLRFDSLALNCFCLLFCFKNLNPKIGNKKCKAVPGQGFGLTMGLRFDRLACICLFLLAFVCFGLLLLDVVFAVACLSSAFKP